MIVPRNRLLVWAGVIVVPFLTMAFMVPSLAIVSDAVLAAFAMLVTLDAILARGASDGVSVQAPEIVRLSKDQEGTIALTVTNERPRGRRLRLGLALPGDIESTQDDLAASLGPGANQLNWACIPRRRGKHILDKCYIESPSPLGLWSRRAALPIASEVRVYANLATEQKHLAALFMNRGGFGVHALRQVGQGREFEKLREYLPSDGYEDIHWKATAKRGRPITKIYQVERTQEVYVIIDASRLSARPAVTDEQSGATTTYLERFITAAMIMNLAAERQGDLFGVLAYSDRIHNFVRAKNGKTHYGMCRDALYTLQPQIVSPDFAELATFIRLRLRRRALLVFLTSLDDPALADSFLQNADLLTRRHLVLVNMIQPRGVRPLFSTDDVNSTEDIYRHLAGHMQWQSLRELQGRLRQKSVRFSMLENERLCVQLVSQYVDIKQRQLL